MTSEVQTKRSGFNFKAFFFSATYYAGNGRFKKGLLLAILGFIPITMIFTGIYAGKKANKDLESDSPFNWKMAILMFIIHASILNITLSTIKAYKAL